MTRLRARSNHPKPAITTVNRPGKPLPRLRV